MSATAFMMEKEMLVKVGGVVVEISIPTPKPLLVPCQSCDRKPTAPGLLEILPYEMLAQILGELDLETLLKVASTNSHLRHSVCSLPHMQPILDSPQAMHIIHRLREIGTARFCALATLETAMRSTMCSVCQNEKTFADQFNLLTFRRVCRGCLKKRTELRPINTGQALSKFGVSVPIDGIEGLPVARIRVTHRNLVSAERKTPSVSIHPNAVGHDPYNGGDNEGEAALQPRKPLRRNPIRSTRKDAGVRRQPTKPTPQLRWETSYTDVHLVDLKSLMEYALRADGLDPSSQPDDLLKAAVERMMDNGVVDGHWCPYTPKLTASLPCYAGKAKSTGLQKYFHCRGCDMERRRKFSRWILNINFFGRAEEMQDGGLEMYLADQLVEHVRNCEATQKMLGNLDWRG